MEFVAPDWAEHIWNRDECTVEKGTNGVFYVVDHSIQTTIAKGTEEECQRLVNPETRHLDDLIDFE